MNFWKKISNFIKAIFKSQVSDTLPTEIKVGDRTYKPLGFLKGDEKSIVGYEMVKRAKEMSAHLGEDDGEYLLNHQQDIPENIRDKVCFVFTNWRHPDGSDFVCSICWNDGCWVRYWFGLDYDEWNGCGRLLRPKKSLVP